MSSSKLILNQLEIANTLANSKSRTDNKIALTLLDNIFEIAMREKPDLVVGEDKKLLKFCRSVKNRKFEEDDHEHRLTRLSVLIEMYLLRKSMPSLSPTLTSHIDDYAHEAADLLAEELDHQIDSISGDLSSLAQMISGDLKFSQLYGQHPLGQANVDFDNLDEEGKLEVLLQMSYFIAQNRDCENCEDKERINLLIEDLKEYLREPDPRLLVDHETLGTQIAELRELSTDLAIPRYQTVARLLRPLSTASREAASRLNRLEKSSADASREKR